MTKLYAGASGYSFKEWQGSFYPEKIKAEAMLEWYAQRLPTVEINNTFYQMPKAAVLEKWSLATPAEFRFAIKASRRITHDARLKADRSRFGGVSVSQPRSAGVKRGPVLFQLPPFLKKDIPALISANAAAGHRAAFEFRHASWFEDDVYALLRANDAALVLSA